MTLRMTINKGREWEIGHTAHMRANSDNGSFREWIGSALRLLAQWIDHRISLSIAFETDPLLTMEQEDDCVHKGLDAMYRCLKELTKTEALEVFMEDQMPEMYQDKLNQEGLKND